jgi:MFS-type transporter involved in bile tolerance (Atg22 family)
VDKNTIPLVYATINVFHVLIGIPSGMLADKIGKEKVMIIGFGVFVIATITMLILAGNSLYAYVLAAIFGTYLGISQTVQRAILPKYVIPEMRGTAFGLYNLVIGTTFFTGNILFGFLWDDFSLKAAISYSLIPVIASIIGMYVFTKKFSMISTNSNPQNH